ncbi:hypothetical protein K439DRAFT_1616933 [Ramaria rubella]|nr:hypothetical protein K439DRAFT_1616933 [Ramaria rubella]
MQFEYELEWPMWVEELEVTLNGDREDLFRGCENDDLMDFPVGMLPNNSEMTDCSNATNIEALDAQVINEACDWIDQSFDDETAAPDIISIIQSMLQVVKKCKTPQAVKSLILTALTHFIKLQVQYTSNPRCQQPAMQASLTAACCMGRGPYFAHKLREIEPYVLKNHALPPSKTHAHNQQLTLLDNETVRLNICKYLVSLKLGDITPLTFMKQVNTVILPSLRVHGKKSAICETTSHNWLIKLGYQSREAKKGLYIDGHEHPDVIESRRVFLKEIAGYRKFMPMVNNETLELIMPDLGPNETLHVVINHDEMSVANNEQCRCAWLAKGQQPLRKKDFILETTGHLCLTPKQLKGQQLLSPGQHLQNGDPWWDNSQLLTQIKTAILVFKHLHPPGTIAHEAFTPDAFNTNNMNIKLGGKQCKLHDTIIQLKNPPLQPGKQDTCGRLQQLSYANDHPDPDLRGKAKGICAVIMEHTSVWDAILQAIGGN